MKLSLTSPYDWERFFFVVGGLVLYLQDQYINHIMNETGATVSLRGRGSGNSESPNGEGANFIACYVIFLWPWCYISFRVSLFRLLPLCTSFIILAGQQPLHLFLSSSNLKGLEDAKLLAENLLDTICAECGASRYN